MDMSGDIERMIEGGGDENNVGSGSENDNEDKNESGQDKKADEENKGKIKVKRKLGPRSNILTVERLLGPRGIGTIESFFSDVKLQGKGKEKEDLDLFMSRLEHWCHRLMPSMQFDDCLKRIEKLGTKKAVVNYVNRIRLGMEEDVCAGPSQIDEPPDSPTPVVDEDPFDQLLSSTVSARPVNTDITAEQREQMLHNRLIAEDRRAARIRKAQEMKEKFKAQHNFNSQTENSTAVELGVKRISQHLSTNAINGGIENNINEQMEIDQNIDSLEKNNGMLDNANLKKYNVYEDCRIEINYTDVAKKKRKIEQNNLTEDKNDNQPDILADGDKNEFKSLMELNKCQPDVVTEKNKNLPKVLVETNKNHTQLLIDGENKNTLQVLVETNENHTELSSDGENKNTPQVLVETNENHTELSSDDGKNKNTPKVLVETNENHTELSSDDGKSKNTPQVFVETNENHKELSSDDEENKNTPQVLVETNENHTNLTQDMKIKLQF